MGRKEKRRLRRRDLAQLCGAVDEVLALVRESLQGTAPAVRDWNDRLLIEAVARGYRCLGRIRELASSGHSEDASALARVLVSLTIRYLWLGRVDDADERRQRLRQVEMVWAKGRAALGRELVDIGYLPSDGTEDDVTRAIKQFGRRAKELEAAGVERPPNERDMALQLDKELQPTVPRFFELAYARIFRTTSEDVHFGLGAIVRGRAPSLGAPLFLEYTSEDDAAEALGLALVTYAFLLDFSEPILHHGLAPRVGEIIEDAHPTS